MRKAQRNCTVQRILQSFAMSALSNRENIYSGVAIVTERGGSMNVVDEDDFEELISAIPPNVQSVQAYIPPRGAAGLQSLANFRDEYKVHMNGRVQLNTYRLDSAKKPFGFVASRNEGMLRSMNTGTNKQLNEYTRSVVRTVEINRKCKIVKLVLEYIVDASGTAWLLRSTEARSVSRKRVAEKEISQRKVPRLMSPDPMKGRRRQLAIAAGSNSDSEGSEGNVADIADRALRSVDSRRSRRGASRGDDPLTFSSGRLVSSPIAKIRPKRRRISGAGSKSTSSLPRVGNRDTMPLASPARRRRKKKKLTKRKKGGGGQRAFASRSVEDVDFSASVPRNFRLRGDARPNSALAIHATLERHSPTELGSSQVEGCPGDFCELDIDVDTGEEKLDDLTLEVMRDMGRMPRHGDGSQMDEALEASRGAASLYVTYKAIAQARAEKRLVQLLIRRMENGTKGEYFNTFEEPESSFLGKSFPSHYYRQVCVCSKCYKMYTKIEKARQRALAKINPSLERTFGAGNIQRPSREHSRRMHRVRDPLGEKRLRSPPSSPYDGAQMGQDKDALFKEAVQRAKDAINRLTKGDIAEFRSFANPPDQVVMVCEALMILLTGDSIPWQAAKRVMANGERFINMLLDFDGAEIPKSRIRALQPFIKDPGFRPQELEPVSKSAAAFCAWVLGTVQAYGYKTGSAHPRLDPLMRPVTAPIEGTYQGDASSHSMYTVDGARPGTTNVSALPPVQESGTLSGSRRPVTSGVTSSGFQIGSRPTTSQQSSRKHGSSSLTVDAPQFVQRRAARNMLSSPPGPSFAEKLQLRREERARHQHNKTMQGFAARPTTVGSAKPNAGGKNAHERPKTVTGSAEMKSPAETIPEAQVGVEGAGKYESGLTAQSNVELSEFSDQFLSSFAPKSYSLAQQRSLSPTVVAFNRHDSFSPPRNSRRSRQRSRYSSRSPSSGSDASSSRSPSRTRSYSRSVSRSRSRSRSPQRGFAPDDAAIMHLEQQSKEQKRMTRREKRARKRLQERQAQRLHNPGSENAGDGEERTSMTTSSNRVFSCKDGVTTIPYEVVGTTDMEGRTANLVVVQDFFDTYESMQIFLEAALRRRPGCQALVFNYPGQANTTFATGGETKTVLNNTYISDSIHELLQHLEKTGEFVSSYLPFYIMGFGNGANIGACFAHDYGSSPYYVNALQGLMSVNGFAHVDTQLAAVLHSSVNVFACFPPSRPDLPVSYFTRFLFSDVYLNAVDPNLVLNIYTAVSNPISLEGRVALCNGALKHRDMRQAIKELKIPVIAIQSTENVLVNPTNVDPFLDGRATSHLWSHQFKKHGSIGKKGQRLMRDALGKENGAFVVWIKAGHEVRQESKRPLLDLIDRLVMPRRHPRSQSPSRSQSPEPSMEPEDGSMSQHEFGASATTSVPDSSAFHGGEHARTAEFEEELMEEKESEGARQARLLAAEQEFEAAMEEHKRAKRLEEQHRRRKAADTTKVQYDGSVSQPTKASAATIANTPTRASPKPRLGVSVDESIQEKLAPPFSPIAKAADKNSEEFIKGVLEGSGLDYNQIVSGEASENLTKKKLEREKARRDDAEKALEDRIERLREEQLKRRMEWEREDQRRVQELEQELRERQRARDASNAKRWSQIISGETEEGDAQELATPSREETISEIYQPGSTSTHRTPPDAEGVPTPGPIEDASEHGEENDETDAELEARIKMKQDLIANAAKVAAIVPKKVDLATMFEQMEKDEAEMKKLGILKMDEYEKVKQDMYKAEMERKAMAQMLEDAERMKLQERMIVTLQRIVRGGAGRVRFARLKEAKIQRDLEYASATKIQACRRALVGRRKFEARKELVMQEMILGESIRLLQRVARGMLGRKIGRGRRIKRCTRNIQRVYRGRLGRKRAKVARERREYEIRREQCATKLQATWRMRLGREEAMHKRIMELAAMQIQRVYRGVRGRRRAARKSKWEAAKPGPERLELGMKLIQESKLAFESQQEEIDELHRAQEKAEDRVSKIHAGLQESEKELAVLERELKDIDHLDRTLHELAHEKSAFDAAPTADEIAASEGRTLSERDSNEAARKRAAESYALEMAIHLKRAERERKKKELESEFSMVFSEVDTKKGELARLEANIADMEATRKRKEREFQRLQRNLMELLEEQKFELDSLRNTAIELETATATSAAAAAATAHKAKENEKKSREMFNSTEELMKFQFMSMSLSYFSSLNMLKNLRDINTDTTAAAVSSSADTAAAAAAASAAANIPSLAHLQFGAGKLLDAATEKRRKDDIKRAQEIEEAQRALEEPLPANVRSWSVDDVCHWLDTLSLSQYKRAFREASIDGDFLLELRPEDMRDVLGMQHSLHVQKVCIMRDKLKPLSKKERRQKEEIAWEDRGDAARSNIQRDLNADRVPSVDVLFSQIRNGRYKKLEEALDFGFVVDSSDDHGNTALIVACQNLNKRMVELLLLRGADINHQNAQGNTPMHYAMAYDPEGKLGEFLIQEGADDSIENSIGLSVYDGID